MIECHFEDRFLIVIKDSHKLEFKNGRIERNLGNFSLFGVSPNASLSLIKTVFNNNIQLGHRCQSCILTHKNANVYINGCEFINHTSKDYPYSTGLFGVDGNLTIISTTFENNLIEVGKWINFAVINILVLLLLTLKINFFF